MKKNILKGIAIIAVIALVIYLGKKFPDQMVLIIGISLILIIGLWLMEADKDMGM
jgi:phosphate starvation-inducible membrane PsiE